MQGMHLIFREEFQRMWDLWAHGNHRSGAVGRRDVGEEVSGSLHAGKSGVKQRPAGSLLDKHFVLCYHISVNVLILLPLSSCCFPPEKYAIPITVSTTCWFALTFIAGA